MKAAVREHLVVPDAVIQAVLNQDKVDAGPHNLYNYPARFAPCFAHEVIKAFSRKGELVLDPFCGGGTTLLEAMRLKRRAAGMDVSSLAAFIARAKTTPLSVHDRYAINAWLNCMADEEPAAPAVDAWGTAEEQEHYERNCPAEARVFFAWVVNKVMLLPKRRQQAFARLILLSVGQWALDCKTVARSVQDLKKEFYSRLRRALEDYFDFLTAAAVANELPRCRLGSLRRVINRDAEGSDEEWADSELLAACEACGDFAAVSRRACGLPPMAGQWTQRDPSTFLAGQPARRRGGLFLYAWKPEGNQAADLFRAAPGHLCFPLVAP
jgi:hypothetical protein